MKSPLQCDRRIEHSNFMSREAVEQAARLGVMPDIQPAWLYLDTRVPRAYFNGTLAAVTK